jgi:hypothetical protein
MAPAAPDQSVGMLVVDAGDISTAGFFYGVASSGGAHWRRCNDQLGANNITASSCSMEF